MFKERDKVIHADYGKGEVTYIASILIENAIYVQFPTRVAWFTHEGKRWNDSIKRSLFFCGPNDEFLDKRPKKMIKKRKVFTIGKGYTWGNDYYKWLCSDEANKLFEVKSIVTLEWEEEEDV